MSRSADEGRREVFGGKRLGIGSVAGIEIRIDRSWLLIALLVTWSFWSRFAADERSAVVSLAMAAAAALLFFGSVLAHELAHSLEARHRGVEVSGITLFLFGGATETSFDVQRPRDEFALTAVGPLTSLVLGAAFGLVAFYARSADVPVVPELAGDLGWINVALALFNLLPGAPLDGGRILRSAVWAVTDDRARAIRVASRAGQVLGWLIAGLGVVQLFLVPGAFVGGIWLIFIGWFLAAAAGSELVQRRLQDAMGDATVGDLVPRMQLPTVGADTDLATVAATLQQRPEDAVAVTEGDRTVGVLHLDDVADVPADRRSQRQAGDHATPIDQLPTVDADTGVGEALPQLADEHPFVVTEDGHVLGVVTNEQLERVVQRALQLGQPPRSRDTDGGGDAEGSDDTSHLPAGGS